MSMPVPPPDDRAPGQSGHIEDHNTIAGSLAALETSVGTLEDAVANTSVSIPLTTLGDTLYENSAPALARLSGNTSVDRMFLRQQGTGTASAAPAWDTLEAEDIPEATTGAPGAVRLAGDLGGSATAPEVLKIQGTAIAAPPGGTTAFLRADGNWQTPAGSATASVFGRTGAVTAQSGDYTVSQVTGAASTVSPTFSGTPAAPTASPGTSTTQVATTAFVSIAVGGGGGGGGGGGAQATVLAPSGTDDTAAINALIGVTGGACLLKQATYYISAPLTPASGSALIGVSGGWSSVSDAYGPGNAGNAPGFPTGTIIATLPGFVGEAAILLDNETTNTLTIGPLLRDFYLDCSAMVTQTGTWSVSGKTYSGNGIGVYGAVVAGQMERVTVSKAQGSCLVFDNAVSLAGTGYPDNWVVRSCKMSSARGNEFAGTGNYPGHGIVISRMPDPVFSDCESSENFGEGWLINDVANGMFSNCKGENNGDNGWHFVGAFGIGYYQNFVGCTSNFNNKNGFLWDETSGGSGPADWNMVGCKSGGDGQSGTGYAGFAASGSPDRIMLTGCFVDGNTQSYGISFSGTCFGMIVSGGSFVKSGSQTFTALHNSGTVTHLPTVTGAGPGVVNNF
jgi:hypothetical protein